MFGYCVCGREKNVNGGGLGSEGREKRERELRLVAV